MVLAAGTTAYRIVELLHVLTVLMALSPVFVQPILGRLMRNGNPVERQHLMAVTVTGMRRVYGPALILAGLLGIALVEMSEGASCLSDAWVVGAIIAWLATNGVAHAIVVPALRTAGAGNSTPAVEQRLEVGWALMSILFTVQLALMIWQPGG